MKKMDECSTLDKNKVIIYQFSKLLHELAKKTV